MGETPRRPPRPRHGHASPWTPGLLALSFALACGGQSGSEGFDDDAPPGGGGSGGSGGEPTMGGTGAGPAGGGIGGMGVPPNWPDACVEDAECMARLEATATDLAAPQTREPRTLVAAKCEPADPSEPCPQPQSCKCVFTTENRLGEINAEAYGIGLGIDGDGCDVRSRGGACLIGADDFTGCVAGDDCSCAETCAHALAVRVEDEARTLEVEARHAECVDYRCRVVLRVGEQCYASFSPDSDGATYDCALSDEEILRRAYPPPPDAGPPRDCTNGCDGGTVTISGPRCPVGVSECSNCYDDAPPLDCSEPDAG